MTPAEARALAKPPAPREGVEATVLLTMHLLVVSGHGTSTEAVLARSGKLRPDTADPLSATTHGRRLMGMRRDEEGGDD